MSMGLSYSRLSTFESCEAKFDYLYVSKSVRDRGSEATDYGSRVHEVLEHYGKGTTDVDALSLEGKQTLKRWRHIVDAINARSGTKHFEYQMCVDKDLKPIDWFSPDAFIRGIADVLVIDGDTAYCLDYKTGKVRDNPTQMQLFASMVFWHFPEVNTVKTSFLWLLHDDATNVVYKRSMLKALWNGLEPRFQAVIETVDLGVFKTKPSGLCPWCPAQDICPDAVRRGRR